MPATNHASALAMPWKQGLILFLVLPKAFFRQNQGPLSTIPEGLWMNGLGKCPQERSRYRRDVTGRFGKGYMSFFPYYPQCFPQDAHSFSTI
tara:strand:- start:154 stop:429 length:276 start_codon:yes stop_codon:yes gene_type:complete